MISKSNYTPLISHRLRRAFLLVDALHGLKRSDEEILSFFRHNAISHQIILSKVDRILYHQSRSLSANEERNSPELDRICEQLRGEIQPGTGNGPEALGEILTCSAKMTLEGKKLGMNNVRWAVLAATGLGDAKRKLLPSKLSTNTPDDGFLEGD